MIPNKNGFWWYTLKTEPGKIKHIAEVQFFAGEARFLGCGVEGDYPCSLKDIVWLGPVNPEPMKVSGE